MFLRSYNAKKNIIFSHKHGVPKMGGEGGRSPTWEKFSHFPVFLRECPLVLWIGADGRLRIVWVAVSVSSQGEFFTENLFQFFEIRLFGRLVVSGCYTD